MTIRRHTSRSTVSISSRVNSTNIPLIVSRDVLTRIDYLVIAAGGGGGWDVGGGGGAGGYLAGSISYTLGFNNDTLTTVIGAGGNGAPGPVAPTASGDGTNTILSSPAITTVTAFGGGMGGNWPGFPGRFSSSLPDCPS